MLYTISNEYLSAGIDDCGAELHSLKCKDDEHEFVWQGDPDIWYGRAPVLFPVIGQLRNDEFLCDGKAYPMKKHGFARKTVFPKVSAEGSRAEFILESNEETLKMYPFDFELSVCFELAGRALKCTQKVTNTGDRTMYFSMGAHPGFNCQIGDYLEFEEDESGLVCEKINSDNLLMDRTFPVELEDGKKIRITEHIFDGDALILSNLASSVVTLKSDSSDKQVRFDFGEAPVLGIWAKPGAPYVCLEPWYGINDEFKPYGDISEKRGIQSLEAEESFELVWIAEV